MAQGDLINYANICSAIGDSNWTREWELKSGTYFFSCHCIAVQGHVDNVLFRTANCSFTAYYWNGSSWVQWASASVSKSSTSTGTANTSWYDNRLNGGDVNTRHQYCLHKIVVSGSASGSSDYFCRIRVGSIGRLQAYEGESGYNTDCKGQPMKFCHPMGMYSDETAFMNDVKPSAWRGVQITSGMAINLTRDDSGS